VRAELQEAFVAHLEKHFAVNAQKLFCFLDRNPSVCRCHGLKLAYISTLSVAKKLST
jgi:hypothetical protein